MKVPSTALFVLMAGVMLGSAPATAQDQTRTQTRTETQTEAGEPIYGSQLMTEQERNEHRARIRTAKSHEERERIRAEHHEAMQARAKERGATLPDMPPQRGPGGGMGGGGMGGGRR